MPAPVTPTPVTQDVFGGMLDRAGLTLTDAQKAALFEAYPLFQAMIARATPNLPREAEPALSFTSLLAFTPVLPITAKG